MTKAESGARFFIANRILAVVFPLPVCIDGCRRQWIGLYSINLKVAAGICGRFLTDAVRGLTRLSYTLPSSMATTVENGAESLNLGPSTEDRQSPSAVPNVQSQIDILADLNKRLQTLRQLPGGVLRSELVSGPNQVLQTLTLKDIFGKSAEDLRTLHAAVVEGKVQDALKAAAESERRDDSEIKDFRERENQKRRCVHHQALFFFFFFFFLSSFLHFSATFHPPSSVWRCSLCVSHAQLSQYGVILQPFSHPRIPETIFASTAEGRGPISPASYGYTTTHAQRPANIHPGVQLDTCEEGAVARLLGTRA